MTTYLGNKKVKIYLNGIAYRFNLPNAPEYISDIILSSSDDYLLADIDEIYLAVQDESELLFRNNYTLRNRN